MSLFKKTVKSPAEIVKNVFTNLATMNKHANDKKADKVSKAFDKPNSVTFNGKSLNYFHFTKYLNIVKVAILTVIHHFGILSRQYLIPVPK